MNLAETRIAMVGIRRRRLPQARSQWSPMSSKVRSRRPAAIRFKPRCDIHTVPANVAEIDPDTELTDGCVDLPDPGIPRPLFKLNLDGAAHHVYKVANSTNRPSPVVLTMRPRCSLIFGVARSRRILTPPMRAGQSTGPN
jgi:hypothetical protein